jgi:F0F1-type ATP synthase assembly protein I
VEEKPSPGLFDLLTMGLGVALVIGAGLLLGLLADGWFHTGPALTFVGLALGVALSVFFVIDQARKYL